MGIDRCFLEASLCIDVCDASRVTGLCHRRRRLRCRRGGSVVRNRRQRQRQATSGIIIFLPQAVKILGVKN